MSLWFRRRYSLPPNDPRFLDITAEEIALDYWANHYQDRADAGKPEEEEIEDDGFDLDEVLAAAEAGDDEWDEIGLKP